MALERLPGLLWRCTRYIQLSGVYLFISTIPVIEKWADSWHSWPISSIEEQLWIESDLETKRTADLEVFLQVHSWCMHVWTSLCTFAVQPNPQSLFMHPHLPQTAMFHTTSQQPFASRVLHHMCYNYLKLISVKELITSHDDSSYPLLWSDCPGGSSVWTSIW